jgi:hypothetical protein
MTSFRLGDLMNQNHSDDAVYFIATTYMMEQNPVTQ